MTTQTQPTEKTFDYFQAGNEIAEQQLEMLGMRYIQHFHENHIYRRNSKIEFGGYAIKDDDGQAPNIGERESIKHRGNKSSIMRVAPMIEVAVIGWSPLYYWAQYDDPADASKVVRLITPKWIKKVELPGTNARSGRGQDIFVALQVDEEHKLWRITFRSADVKFGDTVAQRINQSRYFGQQAAKVIREKHQASVTPHPFMLWLPLGVGESQMAGLADQSPVTPPDWKLNTDTDVSKLFVSGSDFRKFVELRKELDKYLATGYYSGQSPQAQPRIAPPAVNDNGTNANDEIAY